MVDMIDNEINGDNLHLVKNKNIEGVLWSWYYEFPQKTSSNSFSTKDGDLFSYKLLIGYTVGTHKVLKRYTAKGGCYISMATSKQINKTINWLEEEQINFSLKDIK